MTRVIRSGTGPLLALDDLRRSPEPAVVMSSLARLSVPCFSDGCVLELSEGVDPVFEVAFPPPAEDRMRETGPPCDTEPAAVVTTFDMPSADGHPAFSGHVIHRWTLRAPARGGALIARLLVAYALEVVRYERLAETARAAEERSARLARDAMANRSIGEAVGLEMATRRLGRTAATELLKDASRRSGRSLHEISVGVVLAAACAATADSPDQPAACMAPVVNLKSRI